MKTEKPVLNWADSPIPRVGLGTWAMSGPFYEDNTQLGWSNTDDTTSTKAIHAAVDLGIRFFDTADVYGAGHGETLLGSALQGRTEKVFVATKFGNGFDAVSKQVAAVEVTPAYVRSAVASSRQRLRMDCLDLVLLHLNSHAIIGARALFDTLEELRVAGKVTAYGWSTDYPDRAKAFAHYPGFVSVQHAMNVFTPASALVEITEFEKLVSICRSPLAMGLLSGKYGVETVFSATDVRSQTIDWMDYFKQGKVAPEFARMLAAVRELLQTGGRTTVQGALAWILARSATTLPIPGFRTVEQVEEIAKTLEFGPLPQSVMDEIEKTIHRPPEGPPRDR
jgi:aryl-alcohol dehydrogenase-like predicted oxidoreductase